MKSLILINSYDYLEFDGEWMLVRTLPGFYTRKTPAITRPHVDALKLVTGNRFQLKVSKTHSAVIEYKGIHPTTV